MKRLLILSLLLAAAPLAAAHAQATAAQPTLAQAAAPQIAASQIARADAATFLARAQDYLKGIGRVRYEITVEREGVTAGGRAFIDRPSRKARIEIDQPYRDLLLVDGPVMQYEGGDGTITRQATRASPLRLLFQPDVDLARDARLIAVDRIGGQVAITLEQPDNPRAGQITLRFVEQPEWALVGWDFVDPRGVRGRVSIDYTQAGVDFRKDMFRMRDDFRSGFNP